jgi:hypothetical protein
MSATAICGSTHPGLDWFKGGAEMVCDLPPGHRGYHWFEFQPWPRKRGFIHLPGPDELPNDQIGIRPHGGFCNNCDLRWNHPGPHARRGRIWK